MPIKKKLELETSKWKAGVKIEVLNLSTNKTSIYLFIGEASRNLNTMHSTLRKCMENSKPYLDRYVLKI